MIRTYVGAIAGSLCLLLGSCQNGKKGNFTISGTFQNGDKLTAVAGPVTKVFLLELSFATPQPILLDSARIPAGQGHFTLTTKAKSQGVYELAFGDNVLGVPVVNDAPEIKVNVDLGKKDNFYEVSGSEASSQLKDFITVFGQKNFVAEQRAVVADSLHRANAPDSVQESASQMVNLAAEDLNTYIRQFVNSSPNPTVAAVALSLGSHSFTKGDFDLALNELVKKYPDNQVVRQLKKGYDQQGSQVNQQRDEETDWVGKEAPDLTLPDADGKPVSLTAYRGKYLLVDFWASWCGPCRAENPNVVKAHDEFKNKKNFAILGVSLDMKKDDWQKAIQEDKLDWTQVSDLKYWNSKAVSTFQFNGIPYNVLIDPQGKVIAAALHGPELEAKLAEVLK